MPSDHCGIFDEGNVLARHLQPLAQKRRLGDQGRGIALPLARTLGEKLADLRLGVARDDVAVTLLDELDAALERLRRRGPAHRHEGEAEGADAADQE